MAEENGILRIEIDGVWTPAEFSKLFNEFEVLKEMAVFGDESDVEQDGSSWFRLDSRIRGGLFRNNPYLARDYDLEIETEGYFSEIVLRRLMTNSTFIPELEVKAIQFGSPGFVDLLGAGRMVGQISKFLLGIIDRYLATEDRELAREQKRQSILKQKIANADGLLKLGQKVHMDDEAKRQLLRRAFEIDGYIESNLIDQRITAIGPPTNPRGTASRRRRS
jgi:hypothetical protein